MEAAGLILLIAGVVCISALVQSIMVIIGFRQKPWESILAAAVIGTFVQFIVIITAAGLANYLIVGNYYTSQIFVWLSFVMGSLSGSIASALVLRVQLSKKAVQILLCMALISLILPLLFGKFTFHWLFPTFHIASTIAAFFFVAKVGRWQIACFAAICINVLIFGSGGPIGRFVSNQAMHQLSVAADRAVDQIDSILDNVFMEPISIRWKVQEYDHHELNSFSKRGLLSTPNKSWQIVAYGNREGIESISLELDPCYGAPLLGFSETADITVGGGDSRTGVPSVAFPEKDSHQFEEHRTKLRQWLKLQGLSERAIEGLDWIGERSWESYVVHQNASNEQTGADPLVDKVGIHVQHHSLLVTVLPNCPPAPSSSATK